MIQKECNREGLLSYLSIKSTAINSLKFSISTHKTAKKSDEKEHIFPSSSDGWYGCARLSEIVYLIIFNVLLILKCSLPCISECLPKDIRSYDSLACSGVSWKRSPNLDCDKKIKKQTNIN